LNYFRYKLIEPSGEVSSGIAKFPYKEVMSAISHLERDGSTTIYVKKLGRFSSFILELGSFRLRKKLPRSFQAEFLNNLSLMLRSGMTLNTALEEAAASTDRPEFEASVRDIIMNIQAGASFSEAAEKYPAIFPRTVIHLIRLGEETGKLDRTLMDASEHLKRIQTIVSDTKQALLYPSFVFVAMGGGLLFWFYYVVPKIVSLFKEMDVTLPGLTVFLIRLSEFVRSNILTMLTGVVLGFFFMVAFYRRSRRFRKFMDALLLKIPIARSITSASALAFISEYFSLLINVGIDIMRTMDILKTSIRNEVYSEKLEEVR